MEDKRLTAMRQRIPEDWSPADPFSEDAKIVAVVHRLLWPDAPFHWLLLAGEKAVRRHPNEGRTDGR